MKRLTAGEKRIICENPLSPFGYFGWPSVTRLPDGALAVVASGFRLRHVCPFGKGVIVYSRDEGQTWTRPAAVIDTPLDDRDCGIVPFGNGRVIMTSFNNTTAFQRRVNLNRTGAEKKLIDAQLDFIEESGLADRFVGSTYALSEDGGYTFGDVMFAPVTAPHGPGRLNDGTLLYIGRRFSSDDSFDDGTKPYVECWALDSNDKWEKISEIENIYDEHGLLLSCEPHCVQLPNGKILVHIRVQRGGEHRVFTTCQSESADGGRTFTKPHAVLGTLGGAPSHLLVHSGGTVIAAYGYREAPYGIRVMLSRDGGESWDADWILDADGESGDLGYPATVELKDGSLLTVFYENRGGRAVIMQKIWRLPE